MRAEAERAADVGAGPEVRELLAWTVHPARRRPRAAALTVLFILLASAALQVGLRTPPMTFAGALAMLLAASDFLFPVRYRLTTEGAERHAWTGARHLAWAEVRAVYQAADGLKLSTLARPGPLEPYRGLFLPWGDGAEAVRALVDQWATERRRPGEVAA